MRPRYQLSPSLPPLAWLAWYTKAAGLVEIVHGRDVETHPQFFVEGAWAGPYPHGALHQAESVFGSGAVFEDDGAVFVSSSATTDYLYYLDEPARFSISNSLPALLAHLDDELQIAFDGYVEINRSIQDGIHDYQTSIPTRRGAVQRIMWWNLRLDADSIQLMAKSPPPRFLTFDDYNAYLGDTTKSVLENARHTSRKQPLAIFSTQSRGYDSTAVNALAAPHGIDRVFTSPESKEKSTFYRRRRTPTPSDDGTDIGRTLGFECTHIARRSFESGVIDEHYYWAGHDNNQDFNMLDIQQHIERPTMLLTGQLGETWYMPKIAGPRFPKMNNDALFCWSQVGHGLGEIRLATRFIQAAIPFIGACNRPDIFRITESDEMAPWTLNTEYDRPIPRRIAEEAGVPREMFGQIKLASIVHLPTPNVPVTPALRTEFFRHLRRERLLGPAGIRLIPMIQRINNWIYWNNPTRYFNDRRRYPLLWYAGYAYAKLSGAPPRFRMLWSRIDSHLYAFCVNKVRDDYARHLAPHGHAADRAPSRAANGEDRV